MRSGIRPLSATQGVSELDHVLMLLHEQDKRFTQLLTEKDLRLQQMLTERDLRVQQRYDAQTKAVDAALLAAEKAVTKAEMAAEKRFDAVNEFRAAYQDIIAAQMPRSEAEQRLAGLAEKVEYVKTVAATAGGRTAGAGALWGYLAGAAGLAVAIISLVTR